MEAIEGWSEQSGDFDAWEGENKCEGGWAGIREAEDGIGLDI